MVQARDEMTVSGNGYLIGDGIVYIFQPIYAIELFVKCWLLDGWIAKERDS